MDYSDYTKEQLIERIEELMLLNNELLKEQEEATRLEYAWTGNLGHWYWNFKTNKVTYNPLKVTALGYDKSEIQEEVTYQFFTDKLHPEDYKKTMDAMYNHLFGKASVYEVEYRIQSKNGKYKWYYDRGKITQYDQDGKPLFIAGIVFDITEKKEMQLDLEHKNMVLSEMSCTDGLTKIENRRTIIEHLEDSILRAKTSKAPLSIAIFDIDNFKNVNDTKGHVFGDKVLVEVAEIIKRIIRDTDFAGRYGGEEFLVIFSNTDLATASKIAERIRKSIADNHFTDGISITISGGVKSYMGEDLKDFIHEADKNMYQAKKNGKNQIVSNFLY